MSSDLAVGETLQVPRKYTHRQFMGFKRVLGESVRRSAAEVQAEPVTRDRDCRIERTLRLVFIGIGVRGPTLSVFNPPLATRSA